MNKITTTILAILLLITLSLGTYVLTLKDQIDQQASRIAELEAKYNEAKIGINSKFDQSNYYVDLIKRIEEDYSSRKELEDEPSYIRYKEKIESILDENIENIVNDGPLHKGKWFVSKVRFIGPTIVVVYYEDGHDLFASLVQITKTDKGYHLEKME